MRFLLALCMLLLSTCLYAQTFSISGRLGFAPYSVSSGAENSYNKNEGPPLLFGIKLAYEDKLTQTGLVLDFLSFPEKGSLGHVNFFTNAGLNINFKTNKSQTFFFLGPHGGILLPKDDNPMKYYPNPAMGFSVGAQVGGQVELAPHFHASVEASFRYGTFNSGIDQVKFFYFPLVLNLKYEI